MRESGEALVQRICVKPDMQVLDLGCGDGTTALPAAKTGAHVLGVDIASNLVAAGNRRVQEMGITNCQFLEGDATNLKELKDQSFDLVVSIFGAMFAPRPHDVAKETVRVTKRSGRVVMGNWIPNDPTLVAQILKICSAYRLPPEGFVSPMKWGVESEVIERFGAAGIPEKKRSVLCEDVHVHFGCVPGVGRGRFFAILRADNECVRGGGNERPRRRAAERIGRSVQPPERKSRQERHIHSGGVFASDSGGLRTCRPSSGGQGFGRASVRGNSAS